MDYYQGIVTEYLRADRAMFVNTECCIQLNPGQNPDRTGPHWYCDAVAINLRDREVFLCEISFSSSLADLGKRLSGWHANWHALRHALARDLYIDPSWPVTPWVFVPQELFRTLESRLARTYRNETMSPEQMPYTKATFLEEVVPWKYRSWNRAPAPE
jgi:hypothetical protein